jgi:hypothetical protein
VIDLRTDDLKSDPEVQERSRLVELELERRRQERERPAIDEEAPPPTDDDAPPGAAKRGSAEGKASPAVLGREFLDGHHALAARGGLYTYRDGCYRPDGEQVVRRWVQATLGDASRQRDGDEVVYWLGVDRAVDESSLDPGHLINVRNGLLEWSTGQLHGHSPSIRSTVNGPPTRITAGPIGSSPKSCPTMKRGPWSRSSSDIA